MTTLKKIVEENREIYFENTGTTELARDKQLCTEIQRILAMLGYYYGKVDGSFGSISRAALQDFIESEDFSKDYLLNASLAQTLLERGNIKSEQIKEDIDTGREAIKATVLKWCPIYGLPLLEQKAYVLATIEHETAGTFRPVEEGFYLSNATRYQKKLAYYPYYGRGFVQITHDYNYKKYSKILGINFLQSPEKLLHTGISLFITIHGMATGNFTRRRLGDYVNRDQTDFENARRVVNGKDKHGKVTRLANKWLLELLKTENDSEPTTAFSFSTQEAEMSDEILRKFRRLN